MVRVHPLRECSLELGNVRALDQLAAGPDRCDRLLGIWNHTGAITRDCAQPITAFAMRARSRRSCRANTLGSKREAARRPRLPSRRK